MIKRPFATACLSLLIICTSISFQDFSSSPAFLSGDKNNRDVHPTVRISVIDSLATESGDSAEFQITRSDPRGDLLVHYRVGGTASNGIDYYGIANTYGIGSVSLPEGQFTAARQIKPKEDLDKEGTETVIIILKSSPNYTVAAQKNRITVHIQDDD